MRYCFENRPEYRRPGSPLNLLGGHRFVSGSSLKVLCTPKLKDVDFPLIKTTKLLIETRSGT